MPHSRGLPNNPYPELNQPNSFELMPISLRPILTVSSYREHNRTEYNVHMFGDKF